MEKRHVTDQQQLLAGLAREGLDNRLETSTVIAPGGRVTAWAVKVKSHVAYNIYAVRAIVIEEPGVVPLEIGEQMEAINLAESFLAQGTLPVGTYAIMCGVGGKNVFYAIP